MLKFQIMKIYLYLILLIFRRLSVSDDISFNVLTEKNIYEENMKNKDPHNLAIFNPLF